MRTTSRRWSWSFTRTQRTRPPCSSIRVLSSPPGRSRCILRRRNKTWPGKWCTSSSTSGTLTVQVFSFRVCAAERRAFGRCCVEGRELSPRWCADAQDAEEEWTTDSDAEREEDRKAEDRRAWGEVRDEGAAEEGSKEGGTDEQEAQAEGDASFAEQRPREGSDEAGEGKPPEKKRKKKMRRRRPASGCASKTPRARQDPRGRCGPAPRVACSPLLPMRLC